VGLSKMIAQLVSPVERFDATRLRAVEAATLMLRHVAAILAWTAKRGFATMGTRRTIRNGRLGWVGGYRRCEATGLVRRQGLCI
jgi:hypothetical protein